MVPSNQQEESGESQLVMDKWRRINIKSGGGVKTTLKMNEG